MVPSFVPLPYIPCTPVSCTRTGLINKANSHLSQLGCNRPESMRSAISTTMRSILHNSTKDILLRQARFFSSGAHDTVGFIGLGNMVCTTNLCTSLCLCAFNLRTGYALGLTQDVREQGAAMAGNLIKANKKLIVNDMSEEAVSKLCALGAVAAKSPADVASQASTIVTMLPAGPHVLQVYTGTNGILSKVQPGAMLIECRWVEHCAWSSAFLLHTNGSVASMGLSLL